jgi:hypothetical protein
MYHRREKEWFLYRERKEVEGERGVKKGETVKKCQEIFCAFHQNLNMVLTRYVKCNLKKNKGKI